MGKTINKPIFKVAIKNNWKVTMITACVAVGIWALLRLVAGFMGTSSSDLVMRGFNATRQAASGFNLGGNFDMLMIIMIVIIGGAFVHRPALDTSLATYLTVPVSRKSYAITTLLAYYTLIIGWTIAVALAGLVFMFTFGAEFQFIFIVNYFAVVGVYLLVALTISSVSYFAATLFAGTKVKGMYVLIPLAFYILSMFAAIGTVVKELKFMRYLTPYGWFDQNYIFLNGIDEKFTTPKFDPNGGMNLDDLLSPVDYNWWDKNQWLPALICLAIIAACSIASVVIYKKKKLAI